MSRAPRIVSASYSDVARATIENAKQASHTAAHERLLAVTP